MSIAGTILFLFICIALASAVRLWRRTKNQTVADPFSGFHPDIGFTRLDGMVSLSLLLENDSDERVWAEEIELYLSRLKAEDQATEPSHHGIQPIRQVVRPGDLLPISLCAAIYKAAGEPQRNYTCVLSSVLRYRIGDKRFEQKLENYNLRMLGLRAFRIHRTRKPVPPFPLQENIPQYFRVNE